MRLVKVLPAIALLAIVLPRPARATPDDWFYGDETWTQEIEADTRFLGHLGSGPANAGPGGGYYLQGQYGLWLDHFIEGYVDVFHTISGTPASGLGASLRINLLEFSKTNALEFAAESTMGMRCVESRRGLLSMILRSMLLYAQAGIKQYWFGTDPSSSGYATSQQSVEWGLGAQWAPFRISGISRLYLTTGADFTHIAAVTYISPTIGLGVNF